MEILCALILFNSDDYFEFIRQNIDIVNKTEGVKLLLLDNGNTKVFREQLMPLVDNKKIFYKREGSNIGPGGGFNKSMRIGLEKGYKYIYFIDQDSMILKQSLKVLRKEIDSNYEFSFLASAVITEKSEILYYFRNNLGRSMSAYSIPNWVYKRNKKYTINAGGYTGLLINLDVVKSNNIYINEKMIIDYDDYDFTYRLSLAQPGYLVPESKIFHPMKLTSSNLFLREWIRNYTLLAEINDNKFRRNQMRKNYIYMINEYGNNKILTTLKLWFANSKGYSKIISYLKGKYNGE